MEIPQPTKAVVGSEHWCAFIDGLGPKHLHYESC